MRLKHKNVIHLYGVCVYDDPIWIILEEARGVVFLYLSIIVLIAINCKV